MNKANAEFIASKRKGKAEEVTNKKNVFETKKSEFRNAYQAEYKMLIWEAEQRGKKGAKENQKLREEYNGYFPNKKLDTPLQMDKDKKIL
jgi:hypothetical protein